MSLTLTDLDHPALERYEIRAFDVATLDRTGEPCLYCQMTHKCVEVQAYITDTDGEPAFLDSCGDCLPNALELEDADILRPVTLEFQR